MSGEIVDSLTEDRIVELYAIGFSGPVIGREFGIDRSTVIKILKRRGTSIRTHSEALKIGNRVIPGRDQRAKANKADVIAGYVSGKGSTILAREFNISKHTVARWVQDAGIPMRTTGETLRLYMAALSPEDRALRPKKAQDTRRGTKASITELRRRTRGRQFISCFVGQGEVEFGTWLRERGCEPIAQFPIDGYNIDFMCGTVAMEIFQGTGFPLRKTCAQRKKIEYLTNLGFNVLYVWITKSHPISLAAADYAISFLKEADANPSPIGEYRVIRGSGKFVASGRGNFDHGPFVPTTEYSLQPTAPSN